LLEAAIFAIMADIIVSPVFVWLTAHTGLEERRESLKRWLAGKRGHNKNALTKKEIKQRQIIRRVDGIVTEKAKNRLVDLLAKKGLILQKGKKDPIHLTTLSVEWEKLFLDFNPIIDDEIRGPLNEIYDRVKVACIVVLPYPRSSKKRHTVPFETALVDCLGSRDTPVDFLTPAVLRDRPTSQALINTKENESILVIQPVYIKDDYLAQSLKYIQVHSLSQVAEVLTVLDPSKKENVVGSTNSNISPPHRVLIELDLGD
jgi:hypothetical protein